MKAKQHSSSRLELAPQTNSLGLLLLNKCAVKWIQSCQEEQLRPGLKSPSAAPRGLSRKTVVLALLESV